MLQLETICEYPSLSKITERLSKLRWGKIEELQYTAYSLRHITKNLQSYII